MSTPKLMIVDDDRTTVGLLKTLLELDGFEVRTKADGDSALADIAEFQPDAFLVDYHLADKEGTDFVKLVRENVRFQETPIIMTSGLNRETEAKQAGANLFLMKPFDPSILLQQLSELLGGLPTQ